MYVYLGHWWFQTGLVYSHVQFVLTRKDIREALISIHVMSWVIYWLEKKVEKANNSKLNIIETSTKDCSQDSGTYICWYLQKLLAYQFMEVLTKGRWLIMAGIDQIFSFLWFLYIGGYYHGKLVFPKDFPFKPPRIFMITPNGRFKVNTRYVDFKI